MVVKKFDNSITIKKVGKAMAALLVGGLASYGFNLDSQIAMSASVLILLIADNVLKHKYKFDLIEYIKN